MAGNEYILSLSYEETFTLLHAMKNLQKEKRCWAMDTIFRDLIDKLEKHLRWWD